jgi:uncharacterized membrane protein YqhA
VGHTRYVVLLAVAAVLLVAIALFALGAVMAVSGFWHALQAVLRGDLASLNVTVEFLEIVSVMLKAVIFYIVGVGLYSLFIAPLNLPLALGVETLNDLEAKVVSAIVVIMAVTFLEHFILWEQPNDLFAMGVTLALVILALVAFQIFTHWAKTEQMRTQAEPQEAARQELFRQGQTRQGATVGRGGHPKRHRRLPAPAPRLAGLSPTRRAGRERTDGAPR